MKLKNILLIQLLIQDDIGSLLSDNISFLKNSHYSNRVMGVFFVISEKWSNQKNFAVLKFRGVCEIKKNYQIHQKEKI